MTDGWVRGFAGPAVWWIVLLGAYLGIISTVSPTEVLVGAAASAAGAAAAAATRRALLAGLDAAGPRPGWLLLLPVQILRDTAALARPQPRGHQAEVVVAPRRSGAATLVLSTAPGAYVIAVSDDRRVLTLHRVGEGPSAMERMVAAC